MKSLTTLTAAATVAVALAAAPTDAFAQRYYRGGGAAIGLGILGGVAAGAATGSVGFKSNQTTQQQSTGLSNPGGVGFKPTKK